MKIQAIVNTIKLILQTLSIISILIGIYALLVFVTKYNNKYIVDYTFKDRGGHIKYQEYKGFILFECIKTADSKLKIYDSYGLPIYNGHITALDFRDVNDVRIGTGPFEICSYSIEEYVDPSGSLRGGYIYMWPILGWKDESHKYVEISMEGKYVNGHMYYASGDMKFNWTRKGVESAGHGKLTRIAFILPCWLIAVIFGVIPGVFYVRPICRYIFRRYPKGHCINCGYDLRATPDRCPECGKVPEKAMGLKNAAPVQ